MSWPRPWPILLVLACGPRDAEITADVARRTGCSPTAVRLLDEAAAHRVYEIDVRCPNGATRVERAHWVRTGRDQRWVRLEVRLDAAIDSSLPNGRAIPGGARNQE